MKLKKNYKICRRVNQSLYVDIADTFIQYIHSLKPEEIQQLDNNIRANGWAIESIVDIKKSVELLQSF